MRELTKPLKFTDVCSLAWARVKLRFTDTCRHYFREFVTVTTNSGPVRGFKTVSTFGYDYINFFGIPYAKPPIGELRFKDPQPFEPSNKIINRQFGRSGSEACQPDLVLPIAVGNEDCLHLSVFTRDIQPNTGLKPVLVWIHGGAFIIGSNSKEIYNPEYLLRKDIVLISINYRLGAFGFASFKDPELGIPGNAGLKDQSMALKWIKDNCMYFGGDPDNITILGESAGAASVSLHMISNLSKNVFHKAILMSGNPYVPWIMNSVDDWTQRTAKKLGWNGKGGDRACLSILQQAAPYEIIKAQNSIVHSEDQIRHNMFPFGPVIEPYESEQCFLSKNPKQLIGTTWGRDIPIIIGTCSDEGLLSYKWTMKDTNLLPTINIDYALPFDELGLDVDSVQCRELGKQLKQFYFGYSSLNETTIFVYLMILGDKHFIHPTHRMILSRAKHQCAPTYLLRFNFDSTYSLTKRLFAGRHIPGVCHSDDCSYYFQSDFAGSNPSPNSHEWKTIERMCNTFTTFAKTGNPNNETIAPIQWKPVELEVTDNKKHKYKCLNISNEVSYIDSPELDRMHHWDGIYQQRNHNII